MKQFAMVIGAIGLVLTASSASAQDHGFVRGFGGVTFGTAETDAVFGGGVGFNIGPMIQIVGEVGRFQNVLAGDIQDDLDDLAEAISNQFNVPVSIDVSIPAFYVTGGARLIAPARMRLRPFVEGNVGIAQMKFNIDASVAGIDISDEVREEAVGDEDTETDFLLILGGGVSIPVGGTFGVEAGYRYGRIFAEDTGLNLNVLYGAVSVGF